MLRHRIISGGIWAALILFCFYYLPTHVLQFAVYVPSYFGPAIQTLANAFTFSALPLLGVLLAAFALIESII